MEAQLLGFPRACLNLGVVLGAATLALAACTQEPETAKTAASADAVTPEAARAIDWCKYLIEREMMSDLSAAQQHLADQAMGEDIGSSALLNPDGRWRALVMRRADVGNKCSTLITAACVVSLLGPDSAGGDFTARPTFTRQCN